MLVLYTLRDHRTLPTGRRSDSRSVLFSGTVKCLDIGYYTLQKRTRGTTREIVIETDSLARKNDDPQGLATTEDTGAIVMIHTCLLQGTEYEVTMGCRYS